MPYHDFNDDVPRAFDSIYVKYNVKDKDVWWPAVVITSRELDVSGTVKGVAVVEYKAQMGEKASTEDVFFLADRSVTTSNGDTPWRTSAEAADAGEGDYQEADWRGVGAALTRAVPAKTRATSGGSTTHSVDIVPQPSPNDREGRATKKLSRKVRTRAPVDTTTSHLQDLASRVAALEEWRRHADDTRVQDVKAEFVQERKVIWRHRVLKTLTAPLRNFNPLPGRPFSAVLRADEIVIREELSFTFFQEIVRDVQPRGAVMWPSLDELLDPKSDIEEAQIQFGTARALFGWLGVTSKLDQQNILLRSSTARSGVQYTRVLGGLQWTEGVQNMPLRVFVGHSCTGAVAVGHERAEEGARQQCLVPVVEFPTAQWDASNNAMASRPVRGEYPVGNLDGERAQDSVFKVSWTWKAGYDGKATSAHGKRMGSVRVGDVSITIPVVLFRGNEVSAEIGKILTAEFLDFST